MLNLGLNFLQNIKNFIFPFYKNTELKYIFKKLQEGYPKEKVTARFVGGCVRKILMNEKVDDIDLATNLKPDDIQKALNENNIKFYETGIQHGTITAQIHNEKFEITSLRSDVLPDGRHSKVKFTKDWKKDAERRDFTINAIAISLNKIDYGKDGFIDFKKRRDIEQTVFSKYGNKIFFMLILLYIFLIFSFNRFKNE